MNISTLRKSLAAAALLCLPVAASAAPITWTYSGECEFGCTGGITGTLTGNPLSQGFALGLSAGEVINYSFTLSGSISATISGTASSVGGLGYLLNGSGDILTGQMTFGNGALSVRALTGWQAPPGFSPRIGGDGSYTQVPEPATLALLGLGLAGLGLARRRRAG